MNITMATDWALKRSAFQTALFCSLIRELQYSLFMNSFNYTERIVNKQGQVVSKWSN